MRIVAQCDVAVAGVRRGQKGALIVPVIPDADGLNMLGLARKIDELVRRTREG